MKSENNELQSFVRWGVLGAGVLIALVVLLLWVSPRYNIYEQQLAGQAKLKEAESSRQIAVLEARARLESASLQAQAEVERARGVAQANQIIGDSLKGNPEYLQYLYITGLQEQPGQTNDRTVIYVPTEKGLPLPALEATRLGSSLAAPQIKASDRQE